MIKPTVTSPSRSPLWVLALLIGLPSLWLITLYAQAPQAIDFFPLYFAARQVLGGQSPYGPEATTALAQVWDAPFASAGVAYPLPLILLVVPLAGFSFAAAALCWITFGVVLTAGVVRLGKWPYSPLALLLPLCFLPLQRSLFLGQATFIWLGIAVLLLHSMRRGNRWLWAICIVLLVLKPQNGLIFALYGVYQAWRERRQVLVIAAVFGTALAGLSFLVQPGWLSAWLQQMRLYQTVVQPQSLLPWGLLVVLACWRSEIWARLAILQVVLFPLSDLYGSTPLIIAWCAFPLPIALIGSGVSWCWFFCRLPNTSLVFWMTLLVPLVVAGLWQLRQPQPSLSR